MEKIIAYDFKNTEEVLRQIEDDPDIIVFHSMTNEMIDNDARYCVEKMKNIVGLARELHPNTKMVLSLPTPRSDSEIVNNNGQLISAMLKNDYVKDQNISLCDNSNLAFKGKPIGRFIENDGFHLSNQGITMLAANLRDNIDVILKLPRRIPGHRSTSPGPQVNREQQQYRPYRRGYFRGRGRGRGPGFGMHLGRGRGFNW